MISENRRVGFIKALIVKYEKRCKFCHARYTELEEERKRNKGVISPEQLVRLTSLTFSFHGKLRQARSIVEDLKKLLVMTERNT